LLVPLARLANAMTITAEGRDFVTRSRLFHFILEAMVQPCCLLPSGREIDPNRLVKIGKLFGQIMVEHEDMRAAIKDQLKKKLAAFAKEATDSFAAMELEDAVDLKSPRIQALQKLTYICIVIENSFSERRVRNDDIVRDVLGQTSIEALIAAYPATLPPPRQLVAQLALRHTVTAPQYGHSAAAKAVSSLLKFAAGQVTHSGAMVALVCRDLETYLSRVGACQEKLRALAADGDVAASAANASSGPSPVHAMLFPAVSRALKAPSSVLLLGSLDTLPHVCVMDPDFVSALFHGSTDGKAWTYEFLLCLLCIEWLSQLLAQAVRTEQRSSQGRAVVSYKTTFRKLFAFHKSSLLEVCRVSSTKWASKV
jgi:hypothetical protein